MLTSTHLNPENPGTAVDTGNARWSREQPLNCCFFSEDRRVAFAFGYGSFLPTVLSTTHTRTETHS